MQIKLYEEKKKDGQTGRILIILDEPGNDLADFVKKYVGTLGGSQKAVETVAPGVLEPVPEEPERKPDVQTQADTAAKPAAPAKTAETKEEELFPDAPVPEPKAKEPAPKQTAAPAPKQTEEPKKEASASAPKTETASLDEIKELWEMLDDDTKEEYLANYGAGDLDDIEPDYYSSLLEAMKAKIFG